MTRPRPRTLPIILTLLTFILIPFGSSTAQVAIYSEDFENGEAGWFPVDLNGDDPIYWQQSDGTAWCGDDDPTWATPPGYGNHWNQWLQKSFDFNAGQMTFDIKYDTELNFDMVAALVSYDGGLNWDCMAIYQGFSGDAFETHSLNWDPTPPTINLAFHFWSDGGWSDEDGIYPTDGAIRLDNIIVGADVSTFDTDLDGWVGSSPGSNAGPFRLETFLAPHYTTPDDHFWAAYDYLGQFPLSMPTSDHCTALDRIAVQSPPIELPGDQEQVWFRFDVFGDVPENNGLYYDFEVAFETPTGPTDFRSDLYVYYSTVGVDWATITFDLTDVVLSREWNGVEWVEIRGSILEPGATAMHLRLVAHEYYISDHNAAPFFDDVKVYIPGGYGTLAGVVGADCPEPDTPLHGVNIDVYATGTGNLVETGTTDVDGSYGFTLVDGEYTVSLVRPLGYSAVSDDYAVTILPGFTTEQDYDLTCQEVAYEPRGIGYWKHQVALATGGPGKGKGPQKVDPKHGPVIEEDVASEVCDYLDVVADHFNSNAVNQVVVYEPPTTGLCLDKLAVAGELLNLHGAQEMVARARQQLVALLLNAAAGNVHLTEVISEDGATVSQAITFCDNLIDDPEGDHELAKTIADRINSGQVVAAGMIPLDTVQIAYRRAPDAPGLQLGNTPNPFNPFTTISFTLANGSDYRLSVYDSAGKLVHVAGGAGQPGLNQVVWYGTDRSGQRVSSGVYFYAVEAEGLRETSRMVLVK